MPRAACERLRYQARTQRAHVNTLGTFSISQGLSSSLIDRLSVGVPAFVIGTTRYTPMVRAGRLGVVWRVTSQVESC
jgi:hypothetical protein